MCTGLPQLEWEDTQRLLNEIRQRPGSVVETVLDENREVKMIFIQLREQRELYEKFGELVQLDGTYKMVKCGMALYTILVEDNHGVGQPVCYIFLKEETKDSITAALKEFAQV